MAFSVNYEMNGADARVTLSGELDAAVAGELMQLIERAAAEHPQNLVLFMNDLTFMASAGLRVLVFAKQKMGSGVKLYVIGAGGPVLNTLRMSGFHQAVYVQDQYPG